MAPSSSVLLRTTSSATSCSVIETLRCPPVRPYSCCLTLSILSAPSHFTSRRLRPYVTDANHYWRLSVYAPLINTPLRLYALTALLWTRAYVNPTASYGVIYGTRYDFDYTRYGTLRNVQSNRILPHTAKCLLAASVGIPPTVIVCRAVMVACGLIERACVQRVSGSISHSLVRLRTARFSVTKTIGREALPS